MNDAPCRDCVSREVGCHAGCERYKTYADGRKQALKNRYTACLEGTSKKAQSRALVGVSAKGAKRRLIMQLTEADKRTLLDTRKKRKVYMRTEEAYEEEKAAYLTAQKLTGMPSGSSSGAGLEAYVIRRDKAFEALQAASMAYLTAISAALEVIDKIVLQIETLEKVSRVREFCKAYFIEGLSVTEATARQGLAESTGWAYKREIIGDLQ